MSTIAWNSPLAKACTIVSVLVCVTALPAADSARPSAKKQNPASPHANARVGDPCSVGQAVESDPAAGTSPKAISLAKLMSRTAEQAKSLQTGVDQDALSRNLWTSRVAAPKDTTDIEASLALKRIVRQVRSVRFADRDPGPTFTAPAESASLEEEPEAQTATMSVSESIGLQTAASGNAVSVVARPTRMQKTLDFVQQNPDQVRDPLEMAELLFLSGRATEAAPFYAKALDGLRRTDSTYDADRAWILFQLGNCLRETDTAKAQETYMKLVSEYPGSPWTELAKAHGRLLAWYQKSRSEQTTASPQL